MLSALTWCLMVILCSWQTCQGVHISSSQNTMFYLIERKANLHIFFLIIQGRGRHGARAKTKIKPERGLYHLSSRRSLLHILFVHFFCYFVLHHCFLWFLVHLLFMNIFKCNFYNRIERCNGLFLMRVAKGHVCLLKPRLENVDIKKM